MFSKKAQTTEMNGEGMNATVALITGGSRGIGRSTVRNVAERGTNVIFTYQRSKADALTLVKEVENMGRRAAALHLNLGDSSTFDAFAEEVNEVLRGWGDGQFDYLVNNAGNVLFTSVAEATETLFDEIVDVHFKGPFFLTQKLLPLIADGGRIVNVSTAPTRPGVTSPGNAIYASAKGAVEVMTRHMAQELGPRGITVNVVAPGGPRPTLAVA